MSGLWPEFEHTIGNYFFLDSGKYCCELAIKWCQGNIVNFCMCDNILHLCKKIFFWEMEK